MGKVLTKLKLPNQTAEAFSKPQILVARFFQDPARNRTLEIPLQFPRTKQIQKGTPFIKAKRKDAKPLVREKTVHSL
jgi:hypothetical protein